ncbi:MAG: hypothetical protein ACI865_000029 [Flavobacteriaceae bacterium]|jgi:hypothetical protein
MRLLFLLVTLLIVSSCGLNKIRFTRVPQVISISGDRAMQEVSTERNSQGLTADQSVEVPQLIEINEQPTTTDQTELEAAHIDLPETITDSSDLTDTERQIIEWQAQKAEYNAKRSAINSAIFIPSIALGIGASFLIGSSIPFFVGLAIGLAFMIIGIVLYVRSSRSRYITEKGDKILRWALIGIIINSLAIAGIITFIFLL